jgi:type I restriction enzyme S subunit
VFSCDDEYKAKWLYYYFKSPLAKQYIQNYLNGAVQKFLPLGTLRSFPVLPYYDKYISCIDLLFALDSKIELNNRINAKLEAMAKTLYDYWFVQFDFPDKKGKPYKTSGGKMVWNEELKREIPEGWEVKRIEDFGEFKNGINYDPSLEGDTDAKIINVRNISSSNLFVSQYDLIFHLV